MQNFYSTEKIDKKGADINIIFGERGPGKTFALLEKAVRHYWETGRQSAYIRRLKDEIDGEKKTDIFEGVVSVGKISEITEDTWDNVVVRGSKVYLAKYDSDADSMKKDPTPFMHIFAISQQAKYKSTNFPEVDIIILDEFLTRDGEIVGEWSKYQNLLSTIIRRRDDVKIYLLGNTVNRDSVYFENYGIRDTVRKMKPGDLKTVKSQGGALLAIEYTKPLTAAQKSAKYFDFGDSVGQMIMEGGWETERYPRPPKFDKKDIYFTYFIIYLDRVLQVDMVATSEKLFSVVHRKTTAIKDPDRDYIFSLRYDPRTNWHVKMNRKYDKMSQPIYDDIQGARVYFTDADTGEAFKNFYEKSIISTFYA